MKNISLTLFTIILLLSVSVDAQTTQPTPPQTVEDEVVKISTDLVQIDAVVTDKKGNPVIDLTANDIEILQDGKPQKITGFSYVNTETGKKMQTARSGKTDKNMPLPPPTVINAVETSRIITFVVDDGNCFVSMRGMKTARDGLRKFVREQMQPGDLVAIYLSHAGSSLLQQYTSDKTRLLDIVGKIRGYSTLGNCGGSGIENENKTGSESILNESKRDRENRQAVEEFNRDNQVSGTIGVVKFALNGLRRVGGRKILFLLSENLPIADGNNLYVNSFSKTRNLIELANRTSVVINSIDVRGLVAPGAQASDSFKIGDPQTLDKNSSIGDLSGRLSGMAYAADKTGGKLYRNMNFIDYPIQQALKAETGYYLIGYQPEEETFKGKKFHEIKIKLNRADLVVNSRSGFSGITDKDIRSKPRTGDSELYEAVVAPLPSAGLNLRVTAFFANTASEGSFARTLLYLDGKKLTFTDEPDGMKKAVFDVFAVTLDGKNEVVDEFNRTHTIRFPAIYLAEVQQKGLVYSADVPVKKAGDYNFRIAVRDASSKLLGSASQQIEVPNLIKSKIFLSGLTLGEMTMEGGKPVMPSIEKAVNAFATVSASSIPAIRKFHSGSILGYSYKIYNARIDKTTNQPVLSVQVILYRDGEIVLDGKPQNAQLEPQNDLTRINDYGYLKLTPDISEGDYALQIIVKDLQSNKTTSQWIDFEVVK